jgi:hypothetical protein
MTLERRVRALAGSLILIGMCLAYLLSPYFLIVPLFVGANLLQSAFTGFCPAEKFLARLDTSPKMPATSAH